MDSSRVLKRALDLYLVGGSKLYRSEPASLSFPRGCQTTWAVQAARWLSVQKCWQRFPLGTFRPMTRPGTICLGEFSASLCTSSHQRLWQLRWAPCARACVRRVCVCVWGTSAFSGLVPQCVVSSCTLACWWCDVNPGGLLMRLRDGCSWCCAAGLGLYFTQWSTTWRRATSTRYCGP